MDYISAIAVDFGSTNSGCCRVCSHDANGKLVFSNPEFLQNVGSYAKDNTWFYIEPSFMERVKASYDDLHDEDFRIESRVFPNRHNPNIIWGRDSIKRFYPRIMSEGWYGFSRFKMMLYHNNETYAGLDFPLILIIKVFLRIIKIECLELESKRLERPVSTEEIQWGITIPSIWSDDNKHVMVEIAHEVFSPYARILSEPEGPLVYSLQASDSQGKLYYQDGRISFVVDCGGGTTDICLMKENKYMDEETHSESYRIEMIANSDGSAAGGNDIDEAFYKYLLRKISSEKKTDSGISYDSMSDEDLMRSLFDDFKSNVGAFIAFEDNWYKLKNMENFNSISECPFSFTSDYRKWLMAEGHHEVADVVKELLIDGCLLPKQELVDLVFTPTFEKISQKIEEILRENSSINIDRIILAGGMSCNYQLRNHLRSKIHSILGDSCIEKFSDMGPLMAGGAIAAGACYLLLHRDAVIRLARRTYYYDSVTHDVTDLLVEQYQRFGISYRSGDINNQIESEIDLGFGTRIGQGGFVVLSPIAIKNMLVSNFVKDSLWSSEDQTHISVVIYSSDGDFIVCANKSNPLLMEEVTMRFDCKPNTEYKLEVDFNEAQISNAFHYVFCECESGQIVHEGYVENAVTHN